MRAEVLNFSGEPIPRQFVEQWVGRCWRALKTRKAIGAKADRLSRVRIVFVDESAGRKMNTRFRGKKRATDVLSFAAIEPGFLGELVLCRPVLKRQCKSHGLSFREETGYLVLHGLLHLLGFEHEKGGPAARRMFRLQDEIFGRLVARP